MEPRAGRAAVVALAALLPVLGSAHSAPAAESVDQEATAPRTRRPLIYCRV